MEDWLTHPGTEEVMSKLKTDREDLVEELVYATQGEKTLEDIRYISCRLAMLDYILNKEFLP